MLDRLLVGLASGMGALDDPRLVAAVNLVIELLLGIGGDECTAPDSVADCAPDVAPGDEADATGEAIASQETAGDPSDKSTNQRQEV